MFRWIGPNAMKTQLSHLKPLIVTELEAEFEKVAAEAKRVPTRFLRSQQVLSSLCTLYYSTSTLVHALYCTRTWPVDWLSLTLSY